MLVSTTPYFWWHERLWKVPSDAYLQVFNGTPFKNVIWRLLGVKLGRGVFDDGCYLTERTLVSIGDHAMLNAGSKVQCHSQEDGAFKSGYTVIGADCTLGVGAFVHYGVTLGDGAMLDPDSFLMKGETVPPAARWGGNPATAVAAQAVIGANDPLPVLPIIRPGGRHRTEDGDDQPTPTTPPAPTLPAPTSPPAPAPTRPPAPTTPPARANRRPGRGNSPSRSRRTPAPASRAVPPRRDAEPLGRSAAEPGRHRVTVEIPRNANRSAELVGVK